MEVASGVHRLSIPIDGLEPVHAYLLRDADDSWTIFDTGVATVGAAYWISAFRALGAHPEQVARIVVSHHHPDHIGGSGLLHRLTGASLFASASTIAQAPDVWGDGGRRESYFESMSIHLREHGLPEAVSELLAGDVAYVERTVDLPPDDAWTPVEGGDLLEVGRRRWQVLHTPGHADGHLVLLDESDGLLLAGDLLLERISPAVGRFPRHDPDPLGRYLDSLGLVADRRIELVLPGHGEPFRGAADRARELVGHHVDRLESCVEAVRSIAPATAYEVARRAFAHVFARDRIDAVNQRFATTETLAHLERARFDGRLERGRSGDGLMRYRITDG